MVPKSTPTLILFSTGLGLAFGEGFTTSLEVVNAVVLRELFPAADLGLPDVAGLLDSCVISDPSDRPGGRGLLPGILIFERGGNLCDSETKVDDMAGGN